MARGSPQRRRCNGPRQRSRPSRPYRDYYNDDVGDGAYVRACADQEAGSEGLAEREEEV